jgi:predicted Zn-ribbon and HTH transcriptional regulator
LVPGGRSNPHPAMCDRCGVTLGHSAMSAQCPHCPKADVDPRIVMSQKCHEAT